MPQRKIQEFDAAGRQKCLYVAQGVDATLDRVDTIHVPDEVTLARRLLAIFLPTGYPRTVSVDYTAYHVYNALQAFSSSIAGLLASRAVLQGLGVGDENASATSAMLLNVLQESMGRVATILFAHRVGGAIEAECKMYRLLADVLNDAAMVFDCLSPLLPKTIRVLLLGASSVFRALCGVAGGSSKATLSAHFARGGNIGELNAKDSSQETVISLLGMWVGGVIVSYATSTTATWIWLVILLIAHLSTNYFAVSSVRMPSINRQRANIIFSALIDHDHAPSPDQVSRQERIFAKSSTLRWHGSKSLGNCEMGVPFNELLGRIGNSQHSNSTGSVQGFGVDLSDFLNVFAEERYLLWLEAGKKKRATIVLFDNATVKTQVKAWAHALRAMRALEHHLQHVKGDPCDVAGNVILQLLDSTLRDQTAVFDHWIDRLEKRGWSTRTPAMETSRARRIAYTA